MTEIPINYKLLVERFEQIIYDNIAIKLAAFRGFNENVESDFEKTMKSFPLINFVVESLLVDIVLTTNKIVEVNSDRTINYLLNFTEHNYKILNKSFPRITKEMLSKNKAELATLDEQFKRLKTQRDKYYAHSDKQYFLEPGRIIKDFPNTYDHLTEVLRVLQGIISDHRQAIDGSMRVCISEFVYINTYKTVDLLKSASEDCFKQYRPNEVF